MSDVAPKHTGDVRTDVAGETLVLLPERAVCWPRMHTLFIADAHFGKAASFRAHGVPVPSGTTLDGLARADALLARTQARRVVFLGDFLHAKSGRSAAMLAQLQEWRERHGEVEMMLVRGNHDRHAGDPPAELRIECVDEPQLESTFVLAHHPQQSRHGYVLAGHIHPAARLFGKGRQRASLPCYWFSEACGVLPSFGDFTGSAVIEPAAADNVFVIAEDAVVQISARASRPSGPPHTHKLFDFRR